MENLRHSSRRPKRRGYHTSPPTYDALSTLTTANSSRQRSTEGVLNICDPCFTFSKEHGYVALCKFRWGASLAQNETGNGYSPIWCCALGAVIDCISYRLQSEAGSTLHSKVTLPEHGAVQFYFGPKMDDILIFSDRPALLDVSVTVQSILRAPAEPVIFDESTDWDRTGVASSPWLPKRKEV
jgi:hypothetical protein